MASHTLRRSGFVKVVPAVTQVREALQCLRTLTNVNFYGQRNRSRYIEAGIIVIELNLRQEALDAHFIHSKILPL